MRASFFLAFLLLLSLTYSQSIRNDLVNGRFENLPLETIFDSLSSQTQYFFSYNSELLPKGSLYTIAAEDTPIDKFLSKLLIGTGLSYSFFQDQIILNYKPVEEKVVRKKKNLFSISGTVYNEQSKPLKDVNVFLDGTTIGASTDVDGNYKLESVPPGFYNIVFSHIGYRNGEYQLSETNGGSRIQMHQMEPEPEELKEVEVVSAIKRDNETNWKRHYTLFQKEILGQSENSKETVIENPEALDFSYNEHLNLLRAYSQIPIQIRNEALGYRVSYFLESFKLEDEDLRFRGKIRFRNLSPLNNSDKRKWKKNRRISYYGSFNHFKKSLLNNDLKRQGFKVYSVRSLDNFKLRKDNELSASDILVFKGDHYELDFKHFLAIEYVREKESVSYLLNSPFVETLYTGSINDEGILMKEPGNQISVIKLLRNSVRLDLSGEVMDRFGLSTFGYWAWERTADLVPINYDPKYDNL